MNADNWRPFRNISVPKSIYISALLVLTCLRALSQDGVSSAPTDVSPSRNTKTILISLNRTATDPTPADMELKENGKSASIVSVRRIGRIPLHYCLLVDISGSSAKDFEFEKTTVSSFLDKLIKPRVDHGWVVLFNDEGRETTETDNPEPIKKLVSSAVARGGTALYEGMASCANRMLRAEWEKGQELRVMFLFSDGEDDASRISLLQTSDLMLEPDLRIYAITPESLERRGERAMSLFAKNTGGRFFRVGNDKAVTRAIDQISRDLDGLTEVSYEHAGVNSKKSSYELDIRAHGKGFSILAPELIAVRQSR